MKDSFIGYIERIEDPVPPREVILGSAEESPPRRRLETRRGLLRTWSGPASVARNV
jgi:hypothetical protein